MLWPQVPQTHPSKQQHTAIPTNRSLWQVHHSVGRFPTQLSVLPSIPPVPQQQLLIVPGNPGCADFYHGFMQQLHTAFEGTADVLAVSHCGHDTHNLCRGAVWGLEQQVQHKAQLLQELLAPGRPPLIILAHSIGSYIMLQALKQLQRGAAAAAAGSSPGASPLQDVAKVFLLMPFLTTDWTSWEQRLLAAAARQHGPALAAAAGWVQDSPRWLQDLVVSLMLQDGGEPHAAESLRAALNQRGCLNNWHMAAQEFSVLDAPVDWGLIEQLGSKAAVVYNPHDPWFQQYHAMHEVLPGIEAYAVEDLGHAFCLSTQECRAVAQLVRSSVIGSSAAASSRATVGSMQQAAQRSRGALRKAPAPGLA